MEIAKIAFMKALLCKGNYRNSTNEALFRQGFLYVYQNHGYEHNG